MRISQEQFNKLSIQQQEEYSKCEHCGNYFLHEELDYNKEYQVNLCTECDNTTITSKDIEKIKPTTRGKKDSNDGESGTSFWVFPKGTSELLIKMWLEKQGVSIEGYDVNKEFSPTGLKFLHPVYVHQRLKTTVATQRWQLDV